VPLDAEEAPQVPVVTPEAVAVPNGPDSPLSMSGATVDEHFEANPVMELAEIMLSFGRVKGAAQALQEYIDHNPEEALQPWIRLMDVYRMAGMRDEFDRLAQDLNLHFNVEIQHWDPERTASRLDEPLDFVLDAEVEGAEASPHAEPKALTLEDMEHIRKKLIECWGGTECLDYLNQLLRDNRGGKRSGFTLPVVEEILFLIELLETRTSLESQERRKE
jgi:pilus assembly protein FimV